MNDELDLSLHQFDDIPGKTLAIRHTEYVIGDMLGSGCDHIVFALLNRRSQICHHVVKIRRDRDGELTLKHGEVSKKLAPRIAVPFAEIPLQLALGVNGGAVIVQEYAGDWTAHSKAEIELFLRALDLFDHGRVEEALQQLNDLVKNEPHHTVAFYLIATIQESNKHLHEAQLALAKAHEIEPHFRPYVLDLLRLCGRTGATIKARDVYADFQAFIEYPDREIAGLMACILIQASRLDEVGELVRELEDCGDADASRSLDTKLSEAVTAKSKALAILATADVLVFKGEYDQVPPLVNEAYELCPFDYRIILNQAFAYRKFGQFREAAQLLLQENVGSNAVNICLSANIHANAAYCLIQAGKFDAAIFLLTQVRDVMVEGMNGEPVNPVDMPGVCKHLTADGTFVEEPATLAISILNSIPESVLASEANREVVSFFHSGLLEAQKIYGFTTKPTRGWLSRILSGEWF